MCTLNGNSDKEFETRMQAAYGKFYELSPILCKTNGNLYKRLQLFQATVTRTALWCSETWALTASQKRRLRTVQRFMLRKIVGIRRAQPEDYVQRIRRATHIAEEKAWQANVECWLKQHLSSTWNWGGRLTRMNGIRLAKRATEWRGSDWWKDQPRGASSYGLRPIRARRGNRLRWEDDLRRFAQTQTWDTWQEKAMNTDVCAKRADKFAIGRPRPHAR